MTFLIEKDIMTKAGNEVPWVEAGEYQVVRMIDGNRIMIDLGKASYRLLAIVSLRSGVLSTR